MESRPKKGHCSDAQWAAVVEAWDLARRLGGMTKGWGRWRDNDTNRRRAARIWADGHSAEDLLTCMRWIGEGLAAGDHDPKWTSLEHVARHVERYLHDAASGRGRTRGPMPAITAPQVAGPDAPLTTAKPVQSPELMDF